MFYYFSPRAAVEGTIVVDGVAESIASGSAWYDHEFGRSDERDARPGAALGTVSWDWLCLQFDQGWELTIYCMVDDTLGASSGRYAVLVDPVGQAHRFEHFTFTGDTPWTSSKTFARYPTAWSVEIPDAGVSLRVEAAFPAQEFVTMISRPGFWEGRVVARGSFAGASVHGLGFVERSGFERNETLSAFFGAVGTATRRSVDLHPAICSGSRYRGWTHGWSTAPDRRGACPPGARARRADSDGGRSRGQSLAVVCGARLLRRGRW